MEVYHSVVLFFLTIEWEFLVIGSSNVEVNKHLALGIELTAKGQFAEALAHFHTAVETDPNNYLTYYRRATVYLALGKSKSALPDLDEVIKLKPDFTAALLQKGNILLKQGRLDEAHICYENVLRKEQDNAEAAQQYSLIEPLRREVEYAFQLMEVGDYMAAIESLHRPIDICPWDPNLREIRSECYLSLGESFKAVNDLKYVSKLRGDSTDTHLKLSSLQYRLGNVEDSLSEIRECLKLDPDNKECFSHYKKVKKLNALLVAANENLESKTYDVCVEKSESAAKLEAKEEAVIHQINLLLCQCRPKAGMLIEGLRACSEAISFHEDDTVYCYRAEAHIDNSDFDQAINDYKRALEIDGESQCGKSGIQTAQKLEKQSRKRDYYKILGVGRGATKKEINKAYRKLAQKWHPDSFDGEEKKMAEKKFIDIAAAKEVLNDPEKRKKFDMGEDPLDPESQAGQNFNPFGHGFNPFQHAGGNGGGPFQFRFHFN